MSIFVFLKIYFLDFINVFPYDVQFNTSNNSIIAAFWGYFLWVCVFKKALK